MGRVEDKKYQYLAWGLGPFVFFLFLLWPTSLSLTQRASAGLASWMAIWWMTEAVELAITSLLPLVILPIWEVQSIKSVGALYGSPTIFLFFGGFALALMIEDSGLHQRLALTILKKIGSSLKRLVWGFAIATAFLSMWLSNTATTLMILPLADGVIAELFGNEKSLSRLDAGGRIYLAIAYGASIGGLGTLIGTPPNMVLSGLASDLSSPIAFADWMLLGIPLVFFFLPLMLVLVTRKLPSIATDSIHSLDDQLKMLGRISTHEKRVAFIFLFAVSGWIFQPFGNNDALVAILATILAAIIPAGPNTNVPLLRWQKVQKEIPWGILLLFGGGFALASGINHSQLDRVIADLLTGLKILPLPLVILILSLVTTFLTELTSNTATATLILPLMASLAKALKVHPFMLMMPTTLSASCAFMLPVATPPNAIVMAGGRLRPKDLLRYGLWLNLIGALFISVFSYLVLPLLFSF